VTLKTDKNLPSISLPILTEDTQHLQQFLLDIKTNIEGIRAQALTDSSITDSLTTAVNAIVSATPASSTTPVAGGGGSPGQSPQQITGVTALAGPNFVSLAWNPVQGNSAYTKLYRNTVDNFATAQELGTSRLLLYFDSVPANVPDVTIYYYWLTTVTTDGLEGAPSVSVNANPRHITGNEITDGTIGDIQISSVAASKIVAANLAALSANLGDVIAGTLSSTDATQNFFIDLINKFIRISGPNGYLNDDYLQIQNGSIEQFEWTGTAHALAKKLSHVEVGNAANGATVTIPGYYRIIPDIFVLLDSTPVYQAANSASDQTIQMAAENVIENPVGSGSWQFDAVSRLVIAATSGSTNVNQTNGPTSAATITSGTITTLANTTDITLSILMSSSRGTGTAPNYLYRTVSWSIQSSPVGAGTWTTLATKNTGIGATFGDISDSQLATFTASGTWDVRVVATYNDAGGTFASGSGGFIEGPGGTRTAADIYQTFSGIFSQGDQPSTGSASQPVNPVLGGFTPTPGYSIYQVTYSFSYGYYEDIKWTHNTGLITGISASFIRSGNSVLGIPNFIFNGSTQQSTSGSPGANQGIAATPTVDTSGSYNPNFYAGSLDESWATYSSFYGHNMIADYRSIEYRMTNIQAVIKERKPITNSTTASNKLILSSYLYNLSGSTVLGTGTLNWIAVG